jgi:D-hydantoinase
MKVDTVIKNGKIFFQGKFVEAGVAIEGEKITAVAKDSRLPPAEEEVDARGNVVIPGAIDAHVHVHVPGHLYREDFKNATEAAAIGGTTLIMDFVNPGKGKLEKAFLKKKHDGEKLCVIDFSLHAYIFSERNLSEIPKLVGHGVSSFKHFMASPNGVPSVNDGLLFESFKVIKKSNSLAIVHAENEDICTWLKQKLKKSGRSDPLAHAESRPNIAEAEAILRAITFAREAQVPLHIFHVSTQEGTKLIGKAKQKGRHISAETCPQYLLFSYKDLEKFGPFLQVAPPLRSKDDVQAMWSALAEGTIDTVATDHYAPLAKEKEKGWQNIWGVEAGVPGIETRVALMVSEGFQKGRISLERLIMALSTSPAKIFGIYPKKGVIQVGSDADLVIIDLKREMKIKAENLRQKADWTPFEGMEVRGLPILTMVRGKIIAKEGEFLDRANHGKFIARGEVLYTNS